MAKMVRTLRSEHIPEPGGLRVRLENALKELTNICVRKRELVLISVLEELTEHVEYPV